MKLYLFFLSLLFTLFLTGNILARIANQLSVFSGRVDKINKKAKLVRVKVNFVNMKYLNQGNKVELYSPQFPINRCDSYLVAKTSEYYLLRVPKIEVCQLLTHLELGAYLRFESQDLLKNIEVGRSLNKVLLKKQLVLQGKLQRMQDVIDGYDQRLGQANNRYEVLRQKLEKEWADELGVIEDDKREALNRYQQLKLELSNLAAKLEKYRIGDKNLVLDRWALDKELYYRK